MFLRSAVVVFFILGLLASCSEDIVMVAEGDSLPVVYAIFDISDTIHSVRLSKSFAGEQSVEDMLKNPANYFYESPLIFLQKTGSTKNYSFTLNQSWPRQEGYFPEFPNPIYQLNQILEDGNYTLHIEPGEGLEPIVVHTELFSDLIVTNPNIASKRIYFYDDPVSFIWFPADRAYSYEIAFTLIYDEMHETNGLERKSLTYSRRVREEELEWMNDRYKFNFYSDPVFGFIGLKIQADELIRYRKPINLILTISTADQDFTQFISQDNPDSDIRRASKGNLENAVGIVASKYSRRFNKLQISPKGMDSLRSGRFTKDLRFVSNPDW